MSMLLQTLCLNAVGIAALGAVRGGGDCGGGKPMGKRQDTFRGLKKWCNSEFDRRFACWANNHGGWAKMKRFERKRMRKPEKVRAMKEAEQNERVDKR